MPVTATTECLAVTGARIELSQAVLRGGERLFVAHITLVCLTDTGLPARIPADIRAKLLPKRH